MRFLGGLLTGVVLAVAVPLAILATGTFNAAATEAPGVMEKGLATWALDRSVAVHAPTAARNPVAMQPAALAVQEALQDALALPELPKRIEWFDISHIQGAETVASMVVWEDGRMKKSDYRKFIIRSVEGVDDFASMREVVGRRYKRVESEKQKMPDLVLIDGGLGQLHAAAEALEQLQIINQPLAAIAKREEIIYVFGQEDEPVVLDHHSPVLHLVQQIRDEAHRFAVTFHRKRRQMRDRSTELLQIPGVGASTTRRLLQHFGSLQAVKDADVAALSAVVTHSQAQAILDHFRKQPAN